MGSQMKNETEPVHVRLSATYMSYESHCQIDAGVQATNQTQMLSLRSSTSARRLKL